MSATLPLPPLDLVGTEVPLERVEKEISQQMRATVAGEIEDAPVPRVRRANLVIFCDNPHTGAELSSMAEEIVRTMPARVLLLVGATTQPAADITARVLVQARRSGRTQQVCNEQVILRAGGPQVLRLPIVVRSLLIGDLPTNVWWAAPTPPALAGELLYELAEHAQQIIYDSVGWLDPPRGVATTASWLESVERTTAGRWRVASDLNWRRLKYWRRILSEALNEASARGAAEAISTLTVEHGPHAVVQGYLLVSWLSQRLGWQLRGGKVSGGTETTWRFQTSRAEATVTVKRLPDGAAALRRVRVGSTLDGKPVTMNFQPEDGGRLAITLEGTATAARTVTTPPLSPSELIGRQLSDRERDPVFRQSMGIAQQLAKSVLG